MGKLVAVHDAWDEVVQLLIPSYVLLKKAKEAEGKRNAEEGKMVEDAETGEDPLKFN